MKNRQEYFPDGTPIGEWFFDTKVPTLEDFENRYVVTDYGVKNDGAVYTKQMQELIDLISLRGGGLLVIPAGNFISGALFFRQGVHLYLEKGAVLQGSDRISDYPLKETRIEGQNCTYFSAFINIDQIDGLTIFGEGTIDGNGWRSWEAFWLRRKWNPACTNKDEQRARLIYISNSKNILVAGIDLRNAQFWTNHIYKSQYIKYLNCSIFSPGDEIKAPSTDAIDIDASSDILVKSCNISVNDDAIVMKGGKGPWADTLEENGPSERVLVEDCSFGFSHSCFTCGSESIHSKNVIIRSCRAKGGHNFMRLKMRPDTPQLYEHIIIEDIELDVDTFLNINPWTQFYNLENRKEIPLSYAENITIRNCSGSCRLFFDVQKAENQYRLSNFTFDNITIDAESHPYAEGVIDSVTVKNMDVKILDLKREVLEEIL